MDTPSATDTVTYIFASNGATRPQNMGDPS